MALSKRTGLLRLATTLAVSYLAFWSAIGIFNYNSQDLVDQSLFWGAFLPSVLVITFLAGQWVRSGFRPT